MTLQASEVIDLVIATRAGGGELLICDFEPTHDADERMRLLRAKLARYAAYVDTGQYREQLPRVSAHNVLIRVLWHQPPTDDMLTIETVRAHGDEKPELSIPVVFESESDARGRVERENPRRPWWKLW